MGGLMKKAPNALLVLCGTIIALAILASLVFLSAKGKDAAEVRGFVNILVNFGGLILGATATVAAGSANRTAEEAREAAQTTVSQTNGALDARIQYAIEKALQRQVDGDVPPPSPPSGQLPLI